MATAAQEVRAKAHEAVARHLRWAATFAALHATGKPLFRRKMRLGTAFVLICFEWPGVLRVFDPKTGELLCESQAGRPHILAWPEQ